MHYLSLPSVTFIIWNAKPGGMEKVIKIEVKELQDYYAFRIFSLRPTYPQRNFFKNLNITVKYGSRNNIFMLIKLIFFILKIDKNEVFHLCNTGPYILLLMRLCCKNNIIYHIHGTIYWKNGTQKILRKPIWLLGLSKKVKIIANSYTSKNIFRNSIKRNCIIDVVYNPILLPSFNTLKNNKKKHMKICYVGRLSPEKNLFLWLDIAKYILKNYENTTFHLYGEGLLDSDLKEYAKSLNIEANVFFKGYVEYIEAAYQENDLLLFLSKHESFGNVVVESILSGTPVIATSIPVMKEIFENYTEFLIDPNKDLFDQVINKIEKINELKCLAVKAKKEFKNRFSVGKHIKEIRSIYERF